MRQPPTAPSPRPRRWGTAPCHCRAAPLPLLLLQGVEFVMQAKEDDRPFFLCEGGLILLAVPPRRAALAARARRRPLPTRPVEARACCPCMLQTWPPTRATTR